MLWLFKSRYIGAEVGDLYLSHDGMKIATLSISKEYAQI